MTSYVFTDLAAAAVTAGGTTTPAAGTSEAWTVAPYTGTFPTLTAGQVFDVVDPAAPTELLTVTATAGGTWTVTRGAYGTAPVRHAPGFSIRNVVTATALASIAALAGAGVPRPADPVDGKVVRWNKTSGQLEDATSAVQALGNGTFAPTVGAFSYDGSGNITADPDGNTYTWNSDGTPATQTKGGITRTFHWNTDGTLASVS